MSHITQQSIKAPEDSLALILRISNDPSKTIPIADIKRVELAVGSLRSSLRHEVKTQTYGTPDRLAVITNSFHHLHRVQHKLFITAQPNYIPLPPERCRPIEDLIAYWYSPEVIRRGW